MPIRFNTIEELTYALLNEIGLSLTPDGIIYDQDTKNAITCANKQIKASINPTKPVYQSEFTVVFDPLNFKIMNYFLSYYFNKEENLGEFKINAFGFLDNGLKGQDCKTNIRVKFAGGGVLESKYYNNKALKICDIILRLGGYDPDLYNFDKVIENVQ